jgi:hypothetical protein
MVNDVEVSVLTSPDRGLNKLSYGLIGYQILCNENREYINVYVK